jgi:ribonucleoside-diphosphate reductase alpha chain
MRVENWLGENNLLGIDIWNKKYKFENETFEEWLDRISDGNDDIRRLIKEKKFLFAGRILANRGLDKVGKKITYSNCYVIPQVEDNIESIYDTCSKLARTYSYSGGCGIDISKLRPRGMKVNNASNTTTGAVSFMDTFSQVTGTIGQNGRRGALMISIDCSHPDLEEFISIKNDLTRVTKANISVRVTDDFMQAVEDDGDWNLHFETEHGDKMNKVVKAKEIYRVLCKNNWSFAEPGLLFWDRIESYNLLSEDPNFHYAGVNPCAEEPLPAGGSCLLGSINLAAYVKNGQFDFFEFEEDIPVIVKAMNEVLDQGLPLHPLQVQRDSVRDWRQIGIGIMGLADMLIKLELKYDTLLAQKFCSTLGFVMSNGAIKASALLAKEDGAYPKFDKDSILASPFLIYNTTEETYALVEQYGLRNSQILTIAPSGTLSTMLGISGGIEPIFSLSYTRKTEYNGVDQYHKVFTPIADEYMKEHGLTEEEELPNFFVTAQNIDPFKRVEMQGIWQNHIDASISSTVNLPNSATIEEVEGLYMHAWKQGLKGMTIFRDGCDRAAILSTGKPKEENKEEVKENDNEVARGVVVPTSDDVIGLKKKLAGGCGSLHLQVYFDRTTGKMSEVFINKGGTGGCNSNLNALSRMISIALRAGVDVKDVSDQLASTINCPSFASSRAKGINLSPGTSCASAVGRALIDLNKEFQIMFKAMKHVEEDMEEDELMGLEICPECGAKALEMSGGCQVCKECGMSKCD